ncbi:hypothetical protein CEXT_328451 [Caerostris extrusa]|uniref:Uncharacterized protein n=1 Tax=Caerostris extrusa TaxID=172846 RepID=A0AAV4U201_CAEEX|nr:hypothetical protein CEXT_328451 [Caerostris extrusa]
MYDMQPRPIPVIIIGFKVDSRCAGVRPTSPQYLWFLPDNGLQSRWYSYPQTSKLNHPTASAGASCKNLFGLGVAVGLELEIMMKRSLEVSSVKIDSLKHVYDLQ